MSIGSYLVPLVEKFNRREMHAAQGGREVQKALTSLISSSSATTVQDLLDEVHDYTIYLLKNLPPYAPPLNSINKILICLEGAIDSRFDVVTTIIQVTAISQEISTPQQNASKITDALLPVFPEMAKVYTHTLSETVINSLLELSKRGKISRVFVTESRPNNDGWETARRLADSGIQTILTIDASMPSAIAQADVMVSGAEIINANGGVLGKVGAFPASVFCTNAGKPVWILADSGKICSLAIDHLNPTLINASDLGINIFNPKLSIGGSYFDFTPSEFIKGYVTELGLLTQKEITQFADRIPTSPWLKNQLSLMNE